MLYQHKNLKPQSLLQRIFGQQPAENALFEVNNLLHQNEVHLITRQQIESIEQRYRISLNEQFPLNMEEFYAVQLGRALLSAKFELGDQNKLSHLQHVFSLKDNQVNHIKLRLGAEAYEKNFISAVAIGKIEPGQQSKLDSFSDEARLSETLTNEISARTRSNYVKRHFDNMVRKHRVSPAQEDRFMQLCTDLDINPLHDTTTKDMLTKLKLYWTYENLPLPIVHTQTAIQKSETCHLHISNADWYEDRSAGSRYGGTYSKHINTGPVFLTQKRLLHHGHDKTHTIRLEDIIKTTTSSEGITIHRLTGKSPTLKMNGHDTELLKICIQRLAITKR